MKRNIAKAIIQVDNSKVRITKYLFQAGDETGIHKHKYDYIVLPITNGEIILIDKNGIKSKSALTTAESYFRKAGVEHNVINNSDKKLIFVEVELKK